MTGIILQGREGLPYGESRPLLPLKIHKRHGLLRALSGVGSPIHTHRCRVADGLLHIRTLATAATEYRDSSRDGALGQRGVLALRMANLVGGVNRSFFQAWQAKTLALPALRP